jgi:hypothetical protein
MDKRILKLCIAGRKKMDFVSNLMEMEGDREKEELRIHRRFCC